MELQAIEENALKAEELRYEHRTAERSQHAQNGTEVTACALEVDVSLDARRHMRIAGWRASLREALTGTRSWSLVQPGDGTFMPSCCHQ